MAESTKHARKQAQQQPKAEHPTAESVGREPDGKPTPEGHGLTGGHDDEPKGHPTSDRFHSEKAGKER